MVYDGPSHSPHTPQHLHTHYGLDAGTVLRLSKRASIGEECIFCGNCKGDLIII
jgi:hypothetical protein